MSKKDASLAFYKLCDKTFPINGDIPHISCDIACK